MGTLAGQMTETIFAQAGATLAQLAEKLKLPAGAADQMCALADGLVGQSGVPKSSDVPRHSGLNDDGSVYAFSVVLDTQEPEVHLRWQVWSASSEPEDRVASALQAQARLHEIFGASSARFDRVSPLFLRNDAAGGSALQYSARLWPAAKSPKITAHFDAQVLGLLHGPALVEEALTRLGFDKAWQGVSEAMPRGPELDVVLSLSVELSADDAAQVAVRIRHRDIDSATLRSAVKAVPRADTEHIEHFWRSFVSTQTGAGITADTSLTFLGREPSALTLHVAVPSLVEHDGQVASRIAGACGERIANLHGAVVEAVSRRPLDAGVGLTSSVSIQSPGPSVTCELSLELQGAKLSHVPTRSAPPVSPVEAMVHDYEAQPFSVHPFLQRMARGSVDVRHMWLMFSNVYAGLSQHFPRRLARVVLGVEDERIRCILTEQLYEELGSGDYTRTHRRLFLKLLDALSPWKPTEITPEMGTPGVHLSDRLEAVYFDPHPYVGVGAAIVIELLGKQVDLFLAEQFRRQQAVGMASLEWLTLHESLEVDHAGESLELATFIEHDDDRAAAWRGGRAIHTTGWLFFDDMYRLCFGT